MIKERKVNPIRVIDVMTKEEKEQFEDYKLGVELARTKIGIFINERRAEALLKNVRRRYHAQKKMMNHH